MNRVQINVLAYSFFVSLFCFSTFASAQVPSKPTNLSPQDSAQLAPTSQIALSWTPVPGATSYNVRTNNFTNTSQRDPRNNCPSSPHYLCMDGVAGSSISLPVDLGSAYQLFLHACNASGCGEVAYSSFTIATALAIPTVPVGLSPSGTILPYGTASIMLSWNAVPGAMSYAVRSNDLTDINLRAANNNCPGAPPHYVCQNGVASNSLSVPLSSGHSYNWWVHACNAAGCGTQAATSFSVSAIQPSTQIQICTTSGGIVNADNTGNIGASVAIQTCVNNANLDASNAWQIPKGVYKIDQQIVVNPNRIFVWRTQGTSDSSAACPKDDQGSACAVFKAADDLVLPVTRSDLAPVQRIS